MYNNVHFSVSEGKNSLKSHQQWSNNLNSYVLLGPEKNFSRLDPGITESWKKLNIVRIKFSFCCTISVAFREKRYGIVFIIGNTASEKKPHTTVKSF